MKIGIDLDGVLCEFNHAFAELLAEANGKDLLPTGWREDPSVFHCWEWDLHYGYSSEVIGRALRYVQHSRRFWEGLQPLDGAEEVLRHLNQMAKDGTVDCYFITNRSGLQAKVQTERWLLNRGLCYPTVLLASDKVPLIRSLGLTFYADDRLQTMLELVTTAEKEKWLVSSNFYLVDTPWNQVGRIPGLKVVDTLQSALKEAGLWK